MLRAEKLTKKLLTVLVMLALMTVFGQAQEITGKVVGVHDGDTITLLTAEKEQVKVRLEGIDAPELKQAFGNASKQSLSDLVFGKLVRLEVAGKDRYKRTLGHVFVGETWVNLAQVKKGFAWHYKKYSKDAEIGEAEAEAREARLGVWKDASPVAPWDWRSVGKKKSPLAAH